MAKIVVLGGAGAMGQVIVRDLAATTSSSMEILIADFNLQAAEKLQGELGSARVSAVFADLTKLAELTELTRGASVLVNSTPYAFNLSVMEAALAANCNYIDLGGLFHVTKEQLKLHDRFLEANLLAILGMGAAPGMTNIMAAEAAEGLDSIESVDIVVGCADFAQVAHPLLMPYSIDTILDEYTKEPMVYEAGEYRAVAPMSGEIEIEFPKPVGRCKAIMTLHSEVLTIPISLREKGIRLVTFRLGLPAEMHDKLKFLVDLGFAGSTKVSLDDSDFVPRKVLAKMLAQFPTPDQEPDDCEVVRVDVQGKKSGTNVLVRIESIIKAKKEWQLSCGAWDTGVPPSIVAQMIVDATIQIKGVLAPESCVPRKQFFEELEKRGIIMNQMRNQLVAT